MKARSNHDPGIGSDGFAACRTDVMNGAAKADGAEIPPASESSAARSAGERSSAARPSAARSSAAKPSVGRSSAARYSYPATGALVLMALIWGYNWSVTKVALRYAGPAEFVAMRTFLGGVFLFLVLVVLRRRLRPKNLRLTLWVGLFQTAGSIGLATWALANETAGKTVVLVYTMPLWLLLLSMVVLGERLKGLQWSSVGLAVAGLCFVLAPWRTHGSLLSNLLAVISGISWAGSAILAKILSRRHEVDILSVNAWQLLLGSIPLVIAALLVSHAPPVWSGVFIASLLFNIVLVTGVGLLSWFYALSALPAGTAGLATLATPVLGVVFAWLQLGERPDRYEATGMMLIIASLAVLALGQATFGRRLKVGGERYHAGSESGPP